MCSASLAAQRQFGRSPPARSSRRPDAADRRADERMPRATRKDRPLVAAFREGLQKLGWAEGRNIQIDTRWADAPTRRQGNDLQRNSSRCSPISFFRKAHPPLRRCCNKRALSPSFSRTLPIRSAAASSRALRGQAATSPVSSILSRRWPASGWSCSRRLRRASPGSPSCSTRQRRHYAEIYLNPFKAAAASFAVEAIAAPVHDTSELETVVAAQAREPNGGLIVMPDTFLIAHRAEVTSLAARYRLPAVYPYRFFTELGGLLSYGNDLLDNFRRAATYADRILKGAKPSELPVQAPVKFELVINLKTAKALGLDVPLHLQQRADEVIE